MIQYPANTAVFSSVRVGIWYVRAQALDGNGNEVASGQAQTTVQPGQTTQSAIDLQPATGGSGGSGSGSTGGNAGGGSGNTTGTIIGAIDAPQENETVHGVKGIAGWTLERTGSSDQQVSKVEIMVDDILVGTADYPVTRDDGNPGFAYSWDTGGIASGFHRMTARVTSKAGSQTDFERDFAVDNRAPSGAIDSPINNAVVSGTWRIAGWALDQGDGAAGAEKVEILVEGGKIGDAVYPDPTPRSDGNPGFYYDWDTSKEPVGLRNLTARITDRVGNVKEIYYAVTVSHSALLLRAAGEGTVYRVENGVRRAFPTHQCFEDWGYTDSQVQNVSRQVIEQYAWDVPLPHLVTDDAGGSFWLLQYEGPDSAGVRRRITDYDIVFLPMGFTRGDVRSVSHERLISYANTGTDITSVEPRLIVTSGPIITPVNARVGSSVTATFQVKNITNSTVTIGNFTLSVPTGPIPPTGGLYDFPFSGQVTLAPGQTYQYSANRSFSLAGTYSFNCAYMLSDGTWWQAAPSGKDPDGPRTFMVQP